MNPSTVDVNFVDTSCRGAIQVSADDFTTCIPMKSAPSVSNDNKTYTVTPYFLLTANTRYRIAVLRTYARDSVGNYMYYSHLSTNGFKTTGTSVLQYGGSGSDKS